MKLDDRDIAYEQYTPLSNFVTDRLPPAGELVEVLLLARWEPGIVPEARGRWRDRRFETLNGVQGWRLRTEATEAQQ